MKDLRINSGGGVIILFFSGLVASCIIAFKVAAPPEFHLVKKIAVEAKAIQTDRLGNLYVITKTNQLYKYNANGDAVSTLNYKYLGNMTGIDVSNPLEVYLFYKELNMVLFLDNNLAYRGEMNLSNYGIAQATAVARSYDAGVWLFDQGDMQLKKVNKSGEAVQLSGNVKQFVNGTLSPHFIFDNNDVVFVNDSTAGIMVFNVFTKYLRTIPIKGCGDFTILGDDLFYNRNGKLLRYNTQTFTESQFGLPDTTFTQEMSIERNRLYLLKPSSVDIYSY